VTFYTLEITARDKKWQVDKRYNEFFDLHNQLISQNYEVNSPDFALPKKTYFPVRN